MVKGFGRPTRWSTDRIGVLEKKMQTVLTLPDNRSCWLLAPVHILTERETEIVSLLAARDQRAVGMIYDHYADALYGTILRIVRSEAVAEDVFQDAMVKVWRYADRYKPGQGRLFTWLVNICRNTAIDAYRSKSFKQQSENQGLEIAVDQVGRETNTDVIGLPEMLLQLDEKLQVLIRMSYFEGYTQSEIAEELNLPLGTVKTRMRSALSALRGKFNEGAALPKGGLMLLTNMIQHLERTVK